MADEIEVIYDPLPPRPERRDWLAEARAARARGDDSFAIAAAREALSQGDRTGEAWLIRAQSSFALDQYLDAEFAAREAVSAAPQVAETHQVLAGVYEVQERCGEALREAEEAVRLDPNAPMHRAVLASIHVSRGKPHDALPILERLVREDPGEPLHRRALAEALDRDATTQWTRLPNGDRFITTPEQVQRTRENARRGLALEFRDEALRRDLSDSLAAADRAETKRWRLPNRFSAGLYGALFGILLVFGLAGLGSGAPASALLGFFLLVLAAGEAWLYVKRHRQPIWQLDAETARRLSRGR